MVNRQKVVKRQKVVEKTKKKMSVDIEIRGVRAGERRTHPTNPIA